MKTKICLALALAGGLIASTGNGDEWGGGNAPVVPARMGTAVISGKVILRGRAPAGEPIDFRSDPVCESRHSGVVLDETVQVDKQNDLINVLVYVTDGAGKYPPPAQAVTLIQKDCQFIPRMFGIQANQTLEIINDDPTFHTVHAMPFLNDAFNISQLTRGAKSEKKFTQAEVPITFKCGLHYWMHCAAGVFTHPFFAVTGADGSYKITGLPAGTYTLAAFQERYGECESQTVDLKDGETKSLDFIFNAP